MATIVYGTHVFTKFKGYYGAKEECPNCNRIYAKGYVRVMVWAHLEYIPLFPIKINYFKQCPICGKGKSLKLSQAKSEMENSARTDQNFEVYAKHFQTDQKKGLFSSDSNYEVWVKDLVSGEDTCVLANVCKATVKEQKKNRGLKKLEITETI